MGCGKVLAYDWDVASIAGWTLASTFLSTAAQTCDMYCPISFLMLDGRLFESTCRHLPQIDECKEAVSTVSVCALRLILHEYLWATNVENKASSSTSQCFERLSANMLSHVYTKHLAPWKMQLLNGNLHCMIHIAMFLQLRTGRYFNHGKDGGRFQSTTTPLLSSLIRCSRNGPHFTSSKLSLGGCHCTSRVHKYASQLRCFQKEVQW